MLSNKSDLSLREATDAFRGPFEPNVRQCHQNQDMFRPAAVTLTPTITSMRHVFRMHLRGECWDFHSHASPPHRPYTVDLNLLATGQKRASQDACQMATIGRKWQEQDSVWIPRTRNPKNLEP